MPHVVHITEAASGGVWQHLRWILPELLAHDVRVDLIASPGRASSSTTISAPPPNALPAAGAS